MTLEEKVAQLCSMWENKLHVLDEKGDFSARKAAAFMPHGVGQIARPGDTKGTARSRQTRFRTLAETVPLFNAYQRYHVEQTRLGIPAIWHDEAAHGYRARNSTMFPIPPALGSTWDPMLIEEMFTTVARQARLGGTQIALSPVLDLARDPRFGRVEEFFSEDPYLVGQMAIAATHGLQGRRRPIAKDRVFATLKHFIHGTPQGGLNTAPADMSEHALRESALAPFKAAIKAARPGAIMPSLNELNAVPSHASVVLLDRIGRKELGFDGAYLSDYHGVDQLSRTHHVAVDDEQSAVLALRAGVDADLPDGKVYKNLVNLVRSGRVPEGLVDTSVARILAMKFEAGLFEAPYIDEAGLKDINTPADIALARKVAEQGTVLLKNDGIMPLNPALPRKLAVIGPNAEECLLGGYSAPIDHGVGILEGLRRAAPGNIVVEFAEGVRIMNGGVRKEHLPGAPLEPVPAVENDRRIVEAVALAKRSDTVVLVLGDTPETTREALSDTSPGDRDNLDLFGDQNKLVEAIIATGKPFIALLINGRPLTVNRLAEKANALVVGWYMGQEAGNAFANILFGKTNPGGKLAASFPRSVGGLPVYYEAPESAHVHHYIGVKGNVLFPFGFGLSYTSFNISTPRLSKVKIASDEHVSVTVDVTNTGKLAGDEVVQVYIRDEVSSMTRPALELKGFKRMSLAAGETRSVTIDLGPEELGFYDTDQKWVVEPGVFQIFAGNSVAKLLSTPLTVT